MVGQGSERRTPDSAPRRRGTHAKLSEEQKRLITDFLWHGPEAYGFRGEVWTCPRVVDVLAREFGVTSVVAAKIPRNRRPRLS